MRKIITLILILLFLPLTVYAGGHGAYRGYSGYHHHKGGYSHHAPYRYHSSHRNNGWIVPLAIFGGVLGLAALSQMNTPAFSPPQQRICRDTYDFYDEYGNYLYSSYVDRPCY